MCDPQSSSAEEEGGGGEGSCGMLLRDHRERVSVSRPVCLLMFVGSSPGPLCEQHVVVRERHVPRQPLRPVLFPARLSPDADSHRRGPPPGEGTRPPMPCPSLPGFAFQGAEGSVLAHFSMSIFVFLLTTMSIKLGI